MFSCYVWSTTLQYCLNRFKKNLNLLGNYDMNKDTRIAKIQEIIDLDPDSSVKEEIVWQDELQAMPVYKIKLENLVYNKYNGRILTRTKSLEAQGRTIDVETKEGKDLIEQLLWESKEERNKTTLEDLNKFGQKRVGIVTRDGIIIDGNRRAMLLNRSGRYDYFKAIVLPVTLEQDPLEIEKLETSYQMGEDEKLGYNPIEKYLKSQNLRDKKVSIADIASWMNEPKSEIEKYIRTMEIMDEYLETYKYDKMYTQLDGREDLYLSVEKWTNYLYGEGSSRGFDGYKDGDVDDLKYIAFDYIRADYEGKEFRVLAEGLRENHFFGDKTIWKDFSDKHFAFIEPIKLEEDPISLDVPDLEKALDSRDDTFRSKTLDFLKSNVKEHQEKLGNRQYADQPDKLINKAIEAVKVAQTNKNVGKDNVIDKVEELNEITVEIMRKRSPITLLRHINNLLTSINAELLTEDKENIEAELKKIQSTAYQLGKEI